jgi:hypothetical protein
LLISRRIRRDIGRLEGLDRAGAPSVLDAHDVGPPVWMVESKCTHALMVSTLTDDQN